MELILLINVIIMHVIIDIISPNTIYFFLPYLSDNLPPSCEPTIDPTAEKNITTPINPCLISTILYKKIGNSNIAAFPFIEPNNLVSVDNLKYLLLKCRTNNFLTYGLNKKSNYQIVNVRKKTDCSIFDLKVKVVGTKIYKIKNLQINLLGDHNVTNATASIAIALNLGIKISTIKKALKKFSGIQRRFTKVFSIENRDFYDDYAHHPTEIRAVIKSARQVYKDRKIICVFQPHRYSRIKSLKNEFALSFKFCNVVVLCPVYAAGEKVDGNFSQDYFSQLISEKSGIQVINIKNKNELKNFLKKNLFDNEMVICMGAGSISNWIREIGNQL